jgi:hypothetical protein
MEAGAEAATIGLAGETMLHTAAGAISGGINAGITGGDIGIGALTGGISAGVANFAGGILPNNIPLQFATRTAIGGLSGGITSSLYGGSFSQGFLYGAGAAAYGYMCNHVLHDILSAIQSAVVEGSKAGYYSTRRAFYDEWAENADLRNGTADGFIRAGKVASLTLSFVAAKSGVILGLAITPEALMLQNITSVTVPIYDGLLPVLPTSTGGQFVYLWSAAVDKLLSVPPWK